MSCYVEYHMSRAEERYIICYKTETIYTGMLLKMLERDFSMLSSLFGFQEWKSLFILIFIASFNLGGPNLLSFTGLFFLEMWILLAQGFLEPNPFIGKEKYMFV